MQNGNKKNQALCRTCWYSRWHLRSQLLTGIRGREFKLLFQFAITWAEQTLCAVSITDPSATSTHFPVGVGLFSLFERPQKTQENPVVKSQHPVGGCRAGIGAGTSFNSRLTSLPRLTDPLRPKRGPGWSFVEQRHSTSFWSQGCSEQPTALPVPQTLAQLCFPAPSSTPEPAGSPGKDLGAD